MSLEWIKKQVNLILKKLIINKLNNGTLIEIKMPKQKINLLKLIMHMKLWEMSQKEMFMTKWD